MTNFGVGERFKKFCKDYLEKVDGRYNTSSLYNNFRNGIVHSYTGDNKYALGKGDEKMHLSITKSGAILLMIEVFLRDVEKAFEMWCQDLKDPNKIELRNNAIHWFDKYKIFQLVE